MEHDFNKEGKIIVISAPSGTGKSTILNELFSRGDIDMQFSVSATNRAPRCGEVDGENYHFLSTEEFRRAIDADEFVEWEEVYPGRYYGTLKSEINDKCLAGHNIVLDIDVKGATNVKKLYGDKARTIFIMPPSIDSLRQRLESRGTESAESIAARLSRAEFELSFAKDFDVVVINDDLAKAVDDTAREISTFLD